MHLPPPGDQMKPHVTPQDLVSILQAAPWNAFGVEEEKKRSSSGTYAKKTGGIDPALYLIRELHTARSPEAVEGMMDIYTGGRALHRHPEKLVRAGNPFGGISAFYDNAHSSKMNKENALKALCEWILNTLPKQIALINFNYDSDNRSSTMRAREAKVENSIPNFNPYIVSSYVRSGHRVYATSADY